MRGGSWRQLSRFRRISRHQTLPPPLTHPRSPCITTYPAMPAIRTQFDQPMRRHTEGHKARRDQLNSELTALGMDVEEFSKSAEATTVPHAALKAYRSFILPRTSSAGAVADSPQRASVVASQIAFLIRELRAQEAEYLRNRDKTRSQHTHASTFPLTLVLDNLRSAANVGAIFRSAEASGTGSVVTCGITPRPPHPKVLKTALGASEHVDTAHFPSTQAAVDALRERGCAIWALETTETAVSYREVALPANIALLVGNEVVGVDPLLLQQCDRVICIPTHGIKNSLNVSNAVSVVCFEWRARYTQTPQ